jgi:hypothetical protein
MDEPVLILEDDLEFVRNPAFVFEIPTDVDALYLGISGCNYDFETRKNGGRAKFQILNSTYMKVYNMLSAHAKLYISPEYKTYISGMLRYTNDANDVEICKHQSKYNVYVLKRPICWQSSKLNNGWEWIEYSTRIQIDDSGHLWRLE